MNASVLVHNQTQMLRNWRFVQTAQIELVRSKESVIGMNFPGVIAQKRALGLMHNMSAWPYPVDFVRQVSRQNMDDSFDHGLRPFYDGGKLGDRRQIASGLGVYDEPINGCIGPCMACLRYGRRRKCWKLGWTRR
ncbi:MAG: hypothetical protein ACLU4J_16600 [Butyricimonas paravirosa]